MSRIKLASLAMVALMALRVHAAAPVLPPDSVASDSIVVIRLNPKTFTPDALRSAAQAVMGQQANRANDALDKFKAKYDKMASDVDGVTAVVSGKSDAGAAAGDHPQPVVYFHLKPGADEKAVESNITEDMGAQEKEKAAFEKAGDFLIMHEKDKPLPKAADATRTEQFSLALHSISDAAVQIAVVPDQEMRKKMADATDAPAGFKDAVPALSKSKYFTVAIAFGNTPGVSLNMNAASAEDAKTINDGITKTLADFKAQAANGGGGGGPAAMFGPLIAQFADGLAPTTDGNNVSISLKGKSLSMIANIGMSFAGGPNGGPPRGPRQPAQPPQ